MLKLALCDVCQASKNTSATAGFSSSGSRRLAGPMANRLPRQVDGV